GADALSEFSAALPGIENLTWGGFFIDNLIPVTLGNIVGGAIFVGLAYFMCFANQLCKIDK
ncbi:MAG TPA: formate/nitrite transporter family protein, partial [Desulfomonilia bacterium]|nr:formate/nitrite transporter family protein [Desulfomonilia bacterium]